jgi:hypothetical protein
MTLNRVGRGVRRPYHEGEGRCDGEYAMVNRVGTTRAGGCDGKGARGQRWWRDDVEQGG